MNAEERAALVRDCRFELKQNRNDADEESRQDMGPGPSPAQARALRRRYSSNGPHLRNNAARQGVRATPQYRAPRYGRETADQYVSSTADGGDQSYYDASERWDRGITKLRGRQRRGVRPAARGVPYVDYNGFRPAARGSARPPVGDRKR